MTSAKRTRGNGSCLNTTGGGCAVLFIGLCVWWMSAQSTPVVHIPTPVLPNPNAFDTYQKASSQLLESKKIDNASYTAEAAKKAGVPFISLVERKKLVAENAQALATLRSGLDQTYWNPPSRSFYTLMPYYAKFRGLARFLAVDAGVHTDKGEYASAARSSLDAVEMGAQIPHGSTLIGGLAGIACQAIGRKQIWQIANHLDAGEAKTAARRLEKIGRNQFSFAETLHEEKWSTQGALKEFFLSKTPGYSLSNSMGGQLYQPHDPVFNAAASSLYFMVYSKQRIMSDYTSYMDAHIRRAREPYAALRSPIRVPRDPIVEMLAQLYEFRSDVTVLKNHTFNGLLELSLAIRAYRLEHGLYPDTLTQLAPGYLSSLPADPFTAGQSFCYRPNGKTYLLYSVGPDGVDDGGTPIDSGPPTDGSTKDRFQVEPGSKSDIVAGKNFR